MIKPNMGISTNPTESSALADALFPKVRQRVLAVLFGTPGRGFYANALQEQNAPVTTIGKHTR